MKPIIAYRRVSKDKQGRSGLGLEAQTEIIGNVNKVQGFEIVADYIEVETGKGSDGIKRRPQLRAALDHAKRLACPLIIAKLDRLTRNVDLLRALIDSGVDLIFCDMPHVPPGAMGRFILTQMASVAELEAGLISERTKAALAAAKARGTKLGNPRADEQGEAAAAFAETLRPIVWPVINLSSRRIAAILNARAIKTATGKAWHSAQVVRLCNLLTNGASNAEADQANRPESVAAAAQTDDGVAIRESDHRGWLHDPELREGDLS